MRHLLIAIALPLLLNPSAGGAVTAQSAPPHSVHATVETPALYDDEAGGNADGDDPAIWIHPTDRAQSLVIATAKNGGLQVYDLRGRLLQAISTPPAPGPEDESGRFNNVDLVSGFRLAGKPVDLAVVTDRGRDQLRFYRVDPVERRLIDVTVPDVPYAFSRSQAEVNEQRTAYGLAAWQGSGGAQLVVSRRSTPEVGLFRLLAHGDRVSYRRIDTLTLPSSFPLPDGSTWAPCGDPGDGPQVEGMVIDPLTGTAYLAQEAVGLWRTGIAGDRFGGSPRVVERTREFGVPAAYDAEIDDCVVDYAADPGYGGRIAADAEGLAIYPTGPRSGTLLVSSQGDDTFFTYDRITNRPVGRFEVTDRRVDGSQECDGAAVVSTPLPGYPGGLLVVHDGQNTPEVTDAGGVIRPNTNFKFLDAGFLRPRR